MIDVSQWRASIGLWNYCQAASSRPANGHHSHSFKAAVDSKSGSTTSGEKTSKLPAALSLIALLLLLYHSISLLRHILMIPPTGNCYQVQCTTGVTVTDTNYLQQSVVLAGGRSSNLIYNDLYLIVCLRMLLLLSEDVELNPGPMIDDQPSCLLFAKCLKPLVGWKPFALCLPGITQSDVNIMDKKKRSAHLMKMALHKRWLQVNPTASWRDVINALKQCKENELARTIEDKVRDPTDGRSTNDDMEVSSSNANPGPITGNTPSTILRMNYATLVDAITNNLHRVTNGLYAKGLIPMETVNNIQTAASSDVVKSSQLVSVIQRQLKSSLNPEQYLIDICHVLINQQHRTLTDIATSILHQLGQSIPDNVTSISSIPDDVQGYADNMRQHYKHQPIVATDWPPRIGKDFFGRLVLVEKQDSSTQAESAWHLLRGQVDETVKLTENKEISVEDVLQPTDSSLSLRVVIDGPPGIGKTTLCRKLLNMWSNGPLVHQQYDLVLYCPLRNSKIATATTLADMFEYRCYEVPMVTEWFEKRNGEGLLIIFDGWDELSEQLRQSSLAASIIHRKELDQCSVIVTSRSYASSSLLGIMSNLSRHVQVIGFSNEEISTVIIQTLQKDTKLAQELVDENTKQDEMLLKFMADIKYTKYKFHFTTTQSKIGEKSSKLMTSSLLPHIKGLHCLILHDPYPPHLLFLSHPSLDTLTLPLDTAESAIELFTILQTNTTLKALSVKIKERVFTSSMGTSLQDMLTQSQTLKYLEINSYKEFINIGKSIPIPSSFLSFLTTGLRHNTSLQQLSVSIPLNEEIRTFINVISQKNNLTELKVNFKPDQSYSNCSEEEKKQIMTPLFYEQVLPAVTNMLQSHTTIRLLRIECRDSTYNSSQPNWIELVQHLHETIFIHPSLEYIQIKAGIITPPLLEDTLKDQKKTLIDRHRKEQPHKPLPIVNF
uniref:NACHT domain-containing protein n=1 Tax=Amphimedon queenslandica TaxID=400682 RepID=A0A1X7THJ1_AMPQE